MKRWFAILSIAFYALGSSASGLDSLELFVKTATTGQARFVQKVTSNGQGAGKTSSGRFAFARPNRFRFDYVQPYAQTIVGDGHKLWLYDPDLNQVTVRDQAQVLDATPAALIATAPDLTALRAHYILSNAPNRDGLEWVVAIPKRPDDALRSVRLGFAAGPRLETLEFEDHFGQQSVLRFEGFVVNLALDPGWFRYRPPPGADVIAP